MTNPVPAPPTPPSGGMPKWLIIVLVIVLVLVLGCCGVFTACFFLARRAATTIGEARTTFIQEAQRQADEAQKQALETARQQGLQVDTTGAGVPLPANFPADIPVYSGFKATVVQAPPGSDEGTVRFEGTDPAQKIAAFYDDALGKKGWKQVNAQSTENMVARSYTKDSRSIDIFITGDDKKELVINYRKQ